MKNVEESHTPRFGSAPEEFRTVRGRLLAGDCVKILPTLEPESHQVLIADPPYFQVLQDEHWDNVWKDQQAYLDWTLTWVRAAMRTLKRNGLFFLFGQLGKREHVWLHVCSLLAREFSFHDMIIWDRAVGYNERRDSFTPQYEMVLVLRHPSAGSVYFDKDAVRVPYDEKTIQTYLRDKRYKDPQAREQHLRKGKYATNILRVPSLKGLSREKIGHPSQKPVELIRQLVLASTARGDAVLDPFLGSGTTAEVCENLDRQWTGIEQDARYLDMIQARIERAEAARARDLFSADAG